MNTYKIRNKTTGEFFVKQYRGCWRYNKDTGKLTKLSDWDNVGKCFTEKQVKAHYNWLTTNSKDNEQFAEFSKSDIEIVKYELV